MLLLVLSLVVAGVSGDRWLLETLDVDWGQDVLAKEVMGNHFDDWRNEYKKEYRDSIEEMYRKSVWETSFKLVHEHNRNNMSYRLKLNHFADMTPAEFETRYLFPRNVSAPQACSATTSKPLLKSEAENLPGYVNWHKRGVVSKVKNQGHCGSCWTFSTTGAVEAHVAIQTGKHLLFSEQQLIECAQDFDNHGCNGGLPSQAFEYAHFNVLETEDEYPYTAAKVGKCKYNKKSKTAVRVVKSVNITQNDELQIQAAIATSGPVSVAYDVASDFKLYHDGVYDSTVCKSGQQNVNHAVLAVGYGTDENSGKDYWFIKDSWGTGFGIGGYFKMRRGVNMCGAADCASYPSKIEVTGDDTLC